jgi:hypothetical protein
MLQIWPLEVMRSRQIPQIRSLNTVSSRHALDVVTDTEPTRRPTIYEMKRERYYTERENFQSQQISK